jgi:hypothetical protein
MRWAAGAALLLLGACSAAEPAPEPDDLIECALAGATAFARECAVERSREGEGLVLTVRNPDGGFRRFAVTGDGRGLIPADGAEPAAIALRDGGIEVAVGTDRYRFPATIAAHDGE